MGKKIRAMKAEMKKANGPVDPRMGKELPNMSKKGEPSEMEGKEEGKKHEREESKAKELAEHRDDADSSGIDFESPDSESVHPMHHKNLLHHQKHVHEAAGFVSKKDGVAY